MTSRILFSGLLAVSLFLGAGCSGPSRADVPSTPSTGMPSASSQTSLCYHPYFPLKTGYKVAYSSNGLSTTSTYTMEATDVTSNQATLKYSVAGITVEHRLGCQEGAVSEMSYLDLGSAINGHVQATTRNVRGVLLPKDLRTGTRWSTSFEVTLNGTGATQVTNVDATMSADRSVVGEEQVTVEAGTFTALKIEGKTTMHFSSQVAGQTVPDMQFETNEWWVKGKGLVKTQTRAGSFGDGFSSEATSITTP